MTDQPSKLPEPILIQKVQQGIIFAGKNEDDFILSLIEFNELLARYTFIQRQNAKIAARLEEIISLMPTTYKEYRPLRELIAELRGKK